MPPTAPPSHAPLAALGGREAAFSNARAALSRTHCARGTRQIVPGLELSWCVPLSRSSVAVDVLVKGIHVWSATLDAANNRVRWTANQGLFKEDVVFSADLAAGEITLTGDVCVASLDGWQCHTFPTTVLVAWSPTLGAVGGHIEAHPPQVSDPELGTSTAVLPTILRIPVDDLERLGTPVGRLAKQALFASEPDFLVNVCFAVGPFLPFLPGAYGDPTSIWFNVFTGYYEIDCPRPAWKRPFGYTLSGGGQTVNFEDLVRIGKADWNYFSNWMYGVPTAAVRPYDRLDPGVVCQSLGRRTVGRSAWDLVDVDGFSVVSAYQSSAPGAARLVDNTVLTPFWRLTYGEPRDWPGFDTSFPGTSMHARFLMAFSESETAYRTYLFGGTVNKTFDGEDNTRFLAAQMRACSEVVAARYPALGFPLATA
jgi:hypothetical protein